MVLVVLLVYVYCLKINSLNRSASSTETADKLLSGVSGYKPNIEGKVLAVKRFKENVTEELKILQKVNFSMARTFTNPMMPKTDVFAFGVVLIKFLTGRKAMTTKEIGEVVMLWKDIW
ncbi:hypothetical protein JHK82_027938 [Glycine max]|nr:hypothetical protein JHK82_027938 [Glycine max]KAG5151717.1 hypothetical protein JHK84_028189 [Glycine max]